MNVTRRSFLTRGTTAASLLATAPWWKAVAGPFEGSDFTELVPRDKKLDPAWLRSLTARGEPTVTRSPHLRHIGMPVGGIGCGQLYLGGDGRLWLWDIFNLPHPPEAGDYRGPHYARPLPPDSPIDQGFAIEWKEGGRGGVRRLDATGFRDITFAGQYPVGRVTYSDPDCPVQVTLEAFSPFIPLDVDASGLPATVMEFTVRNPGTERVEAAVGAWLQNAACLGSGTRGRGDRVNTLRRERGLLVLESTARARTPGESPATPRPDIRFDDFERADHGGWTAQGTAFGSGPVEAARMPEYQGRVNAQGERLINSHASAPGTDVGARDAATGSLMSPPFTLERHYINLLVGGGAHKGRTCVNLLVDGAVVASVTGRNENAMSPRTLDVRDWAGRTARLEIVDREPGGWGNIGVDDIVLSDTPCVSAVPLDQEEDHGSMALALLGRSGGDFARARLVDDDVAGMAGDLLRNGSGIGVAHQGQPEVEPFGSRLVGGLGRRLRLAPGASATVTFVVAWHFPAVRRGMLSHVTDIAHLRRAYARRFTSAGDVVRHVARHRSRLFSETRLWRKTWYDDSTLPHWFLERTFLNVSTLATATCLHFDNGRFYGWEGTYCCAGTCQHVWQYAQSVGRVFPELERSVREKVDYGLAFHEDTGAIDYRAEAHRVVAIDGLAGTILRAYREHLMSADDAFLRRVWPRVRKSVEHLLARDRDGDGILEGEQYNTLDAAWYGEIAWLSSLYAAAVGAGAEMATRMGDAAFAERCGAVAGRAGASLTQRLFNGEYFIQRVDPGRPEAINTNDGCHIDQVFGQSWAWQVGLRRIVPAAETRRALEALWTYNFTPDVGIYRERFRALPGGRWYAMPGEGGLLMCTWPRGGAERAAGKGDATFVGYFNECMTGFEYQVAAHMVFEGLVEKGLAVTRMIHDRYAAAKRNPFNEVECSSHYARAMASHGVYLAACGFEIDGPAGRIGFSPAWGAEEFQCAFIGPEGWGTYGQQRAGGRFESFLELKSGTLRLERLKVVPGPDPAGARWIARWGNRRVAVRLEPATAGDAGAEGSVTAVLETPLRLRPGRRLTLVRDG